MSTHSLLVILFQSINVFHIFASDNSILYCMDNNECSQQSSENNYDAIHCDGNNACQDSIFSSKEVITASGNSGATYSKLSSNTIYCEGYKSCSNGYLTGNQIYCNSQQSCENTNINGNNVYLVNSQSGIGSIINADGYGQVGGYSDQSAKFATITGTSYVLGVADQSLQHTDMDTFGLDEFELRALGPNTAQNGNVYCRENVACTIYCAGTSCEQLNIYQLTGSNVEIMYMIDETCNSKPNIYVSQSKEEDDLMINKFENRKSLKSKIRNEINEMIKNKNEFEMSEINIDNVWDELYEKYNNEMGLEDNIGNIESEFSVISINKNGKKSIIKLNSVYIAFGAIGVAMLGILYGFLWVSLKYCCMANNIDEDFNKYKIDYRAIHGEYLYQSI